MHQIIAISTRPRVGSMWVCNVARLLVQKAGLNVVPERALKSDEEMLAAAEVYLKTKAIDAYCVIKVHIPLNESPDLKVIYITRDLRDQIFSLCRFMNRPLTEQAVLEMVLYSMNMDSHYEHWPSSKILRVSYESLENDSINLIRRIAHFMGFPAIDTRDIHAIDVMLSKNQVRKKISRIEEIVFSGSEDIGKHSLSRVTGPTGVVRAYDDTTGFQSGHVSDYRAGDWQNLWSDRQKQIVEDAIRTAQHDRKLRDG